jgi:hypothetical protein
MPFHSRIFLIIIWAPFDVQLLNKEKRSFYPQVTSSSLCPKGLDPMVESEEFFTIGQGSIPMRVNLEPWGHLEVVVERVVAPKDTILNGIVTRAHISGSKPTPMSFNLMPKGVGSNGGK